MTPILRDSAQCLLALVDAADKGVAVSAETWANGISRYAATLSDAESVRKLQRTFDAALSRFARKSLKSEDAYIYREAIAIRVGSFQGILAGVTSDGRFLNGCPQEWRWAIDRLIPMQRAVFDAFDAMHRETKDRSQRLAGMRRDEIRAECDRVIALAEAA